MRGTRASGGVLNSGVNLHAVSAIDLLRWTIFLLSALVVGQATLGFLGLFEGKASAALAVLAAIGVAALTARAGLLSWHRPLLADWRPVEAGLLAAVVAAIGTLMWLAVGRDGFAYDSISFHLYFPASWMHSGRLEIVPMVFGDVAPAYNPSNVELIVHLLMAPLQSDYLANCSQIPFALVAVLAIYATARGFQASRSAALCGSLLFLLIPGVWSQSKAAMVDLAVGALFLASLSFLLRLWRAPSRIDVLALCAAWGLFIGSKYVALPFSFPLFVILGAVLWRHRRKLPHLRGLIGWLAVSGTIVLATGGFWYVRNFLDTGNPIFPLHVNLLGLWQLDGLYDSALMRQWDYHVPIENLPKLGEMLLGGGVGFALAGFFALGVRRRGPELSLATIQLLVFWLWVPYQHRRFLFGFFAVVAIAMAVATRDSRTGKLCWLLLLGALAGSLIQWPLSEKLLLIGFGLMGTLLPWIERRVSLRGPVLAVALSFALLIAAGLGSYREHSPIFFREHSPISFRRNQLEAAWQWVHSNISNSHIAYAGVNLPFPLYGRNLTNRVSYANVALAAGAKVHEFPVEGRSKTAEPTLYREPAHFQTWLANLRALECDTLFVATMFQIVLRNIPHTQSGFPVEQLWAKLHPKIFRLRYSTGGARIYDILAPEVASEGGLARKFYDFQNLVYQYERGEIGEEAFRSNLTRSRRLASTPTGAAWWREHASNFSQATRRYIEAVPDLSALETGDLE